MEIKNLEGVSTAEIANTFNEAFSDYLVPISLTESDLVAKMASENTKPEYSAGVFYDGTLVGFILIGTDNDVAYNGGTGVIPKFRGQSLTRKMYDFLVPLLAENGFRSHLLEVISENAKAISVYRKVGFEIARTVTCFNGKITGAKSCFAEIRQISFENLERFWDFKPTYQNSNAAIFRVERLHTTFGAFDNDKLIGYIVFAENGRVKQFAVDKKFRQKGIGAHLFHQVQEHIGDKIISIVNVDDSGGAIGFLSKIGLVQTVQQYEMVYQSDRL